jgi:hypothetical protein
MRTRDELSEQGSGEALVLAMTMVRVTDQLREEKAKKTQCWMMSWMMSDGVADPVHHQWPGKNGSSQKKGEGNVVNEVGKNGKHMRVRE